MISFTVIVPNLNTPGVGRTLQSLEEQDFDRSAYEVIVVGMDKQGQVRESELVRFDRTEVPLSPAKARNRGARQARGEVIAFIDADCVARADWLVSLARCFQDPSVSVVGGGVSFASGGYWTLADNLSMFHEYMIIHPPGLRQQLPSLNLALRRQVFERSGGFDERYPRPAGEDADLTIRLRREGHPLNFEPGAVVVHSPPRHRLADLLRHAYYQGKYSTKVDPRHASEPGLPRLLRTRAGVLLAAPLLAGAVTLRIYFSDEKLLTYWYTAPAIYLAKIAWCIGAANHPA